MSILLWGGVGATFFVSAFALSFVQNEPLWVQSVFLLAAILNASMIAAYCRERLWLNRDGVFARRLLGKKSFVRWKDIDSIRVKFGGGFRIEISEKGTVHVPNIIPLPRSFAIAVLQNVEPERIEAYTKRYLISAATLLYQLFLVERYIYFSVGAGPFSAKTIRAAPFLGAVAFTIFWLAIIVCASVLMSALEAQFNLDVTVMLAWVLAVLKWSLPFAVCGAILIGFLRRRMLSKFLEAKGLTSQAFVSMSGNERRKALEPIVP